MLREVSKFSESPSFFPFIRRDVVFLYSFCLETVVLDLKIILS